MSGPLDRLRALVQALPDGGAVTLPRSELLAIVKALPAAEIPGAAYSVADVAVRLGRKPSTVRRLCANGALRSFRLNGRDFRIEPGALVEFIETQRDRPRTAAQRAAATDLGSWRRVRASNA
jgi:excisionase family DNA binding protein